MAEVTEITIVNGVPTGPSGEVPTLAPVRDAITAITKAEDAVHSTGDKGVMALAVRADTAAATGANGDYVPLLTDATGRLHTVNADSASMLAAFKAEDAVHASGDLGLQALAVRKDTAVALGADGDYAPLEVDSTGRLHVGAAPAATETKVTAATMPTGGVGFVGWLSGIQYGTGLASDAAYSDPTGAAAGTINALLKGLYVESQDTTPTRVELYNDGTELEALPAGRAAGSASTPVVLANEDRAGIYETVAASQTAQVLGVTGAIGDFIKRVIIIPATTTPGLVTLLDNATSIPLWLGGTVGADLKPFHIDIGAVSASGAWKITTGASVSVIAIGYFTP